MHTRRENRLVIGVRGRQQVDGIRYTKSSSSSFFGRPSGRVRIDSAPQSNSRKKGGRSVTVSLPRSPRNAHLYRMARWKALFLSLDWTQQMAAAYLVFFFIFVSSALRRSKSGRLSFLFPRCICEIRCVRMNVSTSFYFSALYKRD